MQRTSFYIVNGITAYRLIAAPFLVFLIFSDNVVLFRWLLAVSFFTDLIDGFLARKFQVTSVLGARLDSAADDFTIIAGITGLFVLKPDFIRSESITFSILFGLFLVQTIYALAKYRRITSFHTYLAKLAAILQGTFLILIFFIPEPVYPLFYSAALVTSMELIEEIFLVAMFPEWKANVKGLYWVLKKRRKASR